MKKSRIAIAVLSTAILSTVLTGCGDDTVESIEIMKDRVTSGQRAGGVVDKANGINEEQAAEVEKYLED